MRVVHQRPEAHDDPEPAELEQREEAEQRPAGAGVGRHRQGEADEPAGVQQDEERVARGIRLDRAEPAQPRGVAARPGEFGEPLQGDQRQRPVERRHRLSSTRKPAVKPGPSAFISARPHGRGPRPSIRSSTNITVAADMLP